MNQSYNQLFDEKDLLEENTLQTVLMGSKKNAPDQRVVIHKFNKSEQFNTAFKDLLDSALQNKLHIEETEDTIILVSKFIEGDNISLHLNFSSVTAEERLDYLYEYLHQAVAYIGFDNYLFNILISSNQVVFIDHQLYLKEKIVIDRNFNSEMQFSMVAKNIGQVLQRLLITNYNELRTSKKYDDLHIFTESLIRREKKYTCFDDLFNDFKGIYFTKSFSKRHVLLGEAHPNNMYLEQTQELPFIAQEEPVVEEPEVKPKKNTTSEVTEEERAMLTGPIEENIDLSKLTESVSSFDELLIPEDQDESTEESQESSQEESQYEPTYGVPSHFKEDTHDDEIEPSRKKKNIDLKLILLIFLMTVIAAASIFLVVKLFEPNDSVPQPPEAKFEVTIEGDTLICTNLSTAFNDEIIVESFWVLSKDGKEIATKPGSNKADFKVSSLTEGIYEISLTVTDSAKQFSDPFIKEKEYLSPESKALENQISTEERLAPSQKFSKSTDDNDDLLDLYAISATENVVEDKAISHTGNRSYKINVTDGNATLSFNDLDIEKNATVSFWMMTDKQEPIEFQIQGFKNDLINYNHSMHTTEDQVLSWKVVSVQLSLEESTDELVFRFPQKNMTIWFDDLSIRTFK